MYSKILLILCSILLCAGNDAVEKIAKARKHKAKYRKSSITPKCRNHTHGCGCKTEIGEPNRVVIKTNKMQNITSNHCSVCFFFSALSITIAMAKPTTKQTTEIIIVHTLSKLCGMVLSDDEITNPRMIRDIIA